MQSHRLSDEYSVASARPSIGDAHCSDAEFAEVSCAHALVPGKESSGQDRITS